MTHTTTLEPLEVDQWFVDRSELRSFVSIVQKIVSTTRDRAETLTTIEPYFSQLLKQNSWLPEQFAQPNSDSNMGSSIGQWLLYRSKERTLAIFSLVIPPGSTTPIHDHLSWGLVGLYKGAQEETVYRRVDNGELEGHAQLEKIDVSQVKKGHVYHILPPDQDIHSVKATTIFTPSVSIHVMGNDTGSIWRHQYNPETQSVRSFRSGYSNALFRRVGK
jgi:3-mercaptopropionate dioxygenase